MRSNVSRLESNINEMTIVVPQLLLLLLLIAFSCHWRRPRLVVSIAVGRCVLVAMATVDERCSSDGVAWYAGAVQSVVDL